MIVVAGGTGMVGGMVCSMLSAAGSPTRALVRATSNPEKVASLKALGVETVVVDLGDMVSLEGACAGAEAVISTLSSMPFSYEAGVNDIRTTDLDGLRNLIDAAARCDVGRFVYTSISGNMDLDFPLGKAKRAVERHLVDSGLGYTILRPSFFMEVWLSPAVGFDPGHGTVTVYGDGTEPVSYIAAADVAGVAVASLGSPGALNAVLELGGPEALSQLEVKTVFEQAAGRPVEIQFVPVAALREQAAGATDGMQLSFISLMMCLAKGDAIDMDDVRIDLPAPLTSVKQFALAQAASPLAGGPAS